MQETGYIKSFENDEITIKLSDLTDEQRYLIKHALFTQSTMYFDDGRHITVDQRKKIFALFNDMSNFTGNSVSTIEEMMKVKFIEKMENPHWFSFSNCSIQIAKQFLEFCLDFCITERIPFKTMFVDSIQQSYGLRYKLVMNRMCYVCGRHADIDHFKTIGTGRNRRKVYQVGMLVWPLCRKHHSERHTIGVKSIMQKYQIKPIKLNKYMIDKLGLANKGAQEKDEK